MVQVAFTYTAERLVESLRRYRRQSQQFGTWLYWLVAVLVGLGGILAVGNGGWFWGLWAIAFAIFLPASPRLGEWLARRSFRKSPFADEDVVWRFDSHGFHGTTGKSDARLQWSAFTEVVHFSDGLMLFTGPRVFYWIAASDFGRPEQAVQFEALVREKVNKHRVVEERNHRDLLTSIWSCFWMPVAALLLGISFIGASVSKLPNARHDWYLDDHLCFAVSVVAGLLAMLPHAPRRYSLRTVLIVMTVFGVAMTVLAILERTSGLAVHGGR